MTGDLFALASAACFAVSNVTIARGAGPDAEDNGAFTSLLLTAALSGAGWLVSGALHGFVPASGRAILWFMGAGVLTAFIGRVFLYASVQRLGAMRASAIKRLNPFFAVALGVGVMGERLTPGMLAGMAFIVASFAVLVAASSSGGGDAGRKVARIGYVYGPVSALGYASGYVLRKAGLIEAPDPFLGTCIGALVAVALYVGMGAFDAGYARAVRSTFAHPSRWLLAAGVASSLGQISYFFALRSSPISRVALLVSMEVFLTIFLSVWLLRKSESLTPAVALAAVLGVAGTACIFST